MSAGWPGEPIAGGPLPELGDSLGGGYLGETFSARCGLTGERIAIKRIAVALADDPVFMRFEAEVLPRVRELSRPGIVAVSASFRLGDHPAFAMPFFGGEDVRRYRGRPLPEVLSAFDSLLVTLSACHDAGLAHGGLRASNLLCDDEGRIQLADLGFAALVHRLPGPRQMRMADGGPELSPALRAGAPTASVADDVFALGALLYEWVAARPAPSVGGPGPRVLPPIGLPGTTEQSVPRSFSVLVASMLQVEPSDRPESLVEVRDALVEVQSELSQASTPLLTPRRSNASARESSPPADSHPAARRARFRPLRNAWLALFGAALLGAAGLAWLQYSVEGSGVYDAPVIVDAPVEKPVLVGDAALVDSFTEARQRAVLTAAHAALLERLDRLSDRGAGDWAGARFAATRAALDEIPAALVRADMTAAESAEARSLALIEGMEGRASDLLSESLRSGVAALARGDVASAKGHFERADRLDPGNDGAGRGLARAARRPEVLALLGDARRETTRPGRLGTALSLAGRAVELDPEFEPAREMLASLEARSAAEQLLADVAQHRERARAFEAQERWADAVVEYEAALAADADLEFATDALPRVRERAALDAQLAALSQDPRGIFSRSGRAQAGRVIAAGRAVADPGSRLARQLSVVVAALELANTPVPVSLVSDRQTEVTIYHVGRQGRFDRKQLELLPGDYTVVGARDGFRDVRRRLQVKPGAASADLAIVCEEAL